MNRYTFHITLSDISFFAVIFIGLTFALLLWFTKTPNRAANRYLALATLTMIAEMIRILATDIQLERYIKHWEWFPMHLLLATGPLTWFYVRKITAPAVQFRRKDLFHFIPLLVQQAVVTIAIKQSIDMGSKIAVTPVFHLLNPLLQLLIFTSAITYLWFSNKLINRFYQCLQPVLMDRPLLEFRWLRKLIIATACLWVLWIASAMLDFSGYREQSGVQLYYPVYLFFAVMIIWTATAAYLRPQAGTKTEPVADGRVLAVPAVSAELRQKADWIKRQVEVNRHYEDPDLNLGLLAEKLGLHTHELSRVINTVFKKTFNDFISEYRVTAVILKIQDPAWDKLTLAGIALDSGFNSKSSFNRIFKQLTGKNPLEYKSALKKELPTYNLRHRAATGRLILKQQPAMKWAPVKFNHQLMFRNYLKIAWRNLLRSRAQSSLNIFGLATGMAIALVIGLWAIDELSIDQDIPDGDRVVEIMQSQWPKGQTDEKTPPAYVGYTVSPALNAWLQKGNYKEVFEQTAMTLWAGQHLLVTGDKSIAQTGTSAEYTFPLIFGFRFLSGTAESMRDPNTALISRSTAIALYGTENAVGKTFKYENRRPFIVGGVYADQPANSSLREFEFFISMANEETSWVRNIDNFENHSCRMFARLAGNITADHATARVKNICSPYVKFAYETYKVLPFQNLYLHFDDSNSVGDGRIVYVRMLGIIGVFILLLACINFMNLATARSEKRAKEVGIRKTVGSLRSHLIAQFLGESVLLSSLSFVIAVVLAGLTLPWFNQLAGKSMTFPWTSPLFWIVSLICTLLTGLLAGSYPAFYLSGFRPVKVLKGTFKAGKGASSPRKVLVVAQFSISLALIIGTIVVFRQIQFAKNQPLGYEQAGLITVPVNTEELDNHYEALRQGLLGTGVIAGIANSSTTLNAFYMNNFLEWEGMSEEAKNLSFRDIFVNADFGPTIGWNIIKGRDFSREHVTDSTAAIVNETGARIIGVKDPIGKTIKHWGKSYTIIGVTKDIISNSPYYPVQPAIFLGDGGHGVFTIRIKPGTPVRTALAAMEPVFKQFNPASPFIYSFIDEEYQKKFNTESRIGNLATVFSALAILISCLGLFGLASFVAEQRTKEIGVRKVLGARVTGLWALLSADFIKLVMLSMLIAMPLSYYCMDQWLQNYALHTSLSVWIFVIAGGGLLFVTLATVSYQAIRAALTNPVKSLRTE